MGGKPGTACGLVNFRSLPAGRMSTNLRAFSKKAHAQLNHKITRGKAKNNEADIRGNRCLKELLGFVSRTCGKSLTVRGKVRCPGFTVHYRAQEVLDYICDPESLL